LNPESITPDQILDCYGLCCPVPVHKTAQALKQLVANQILEVVATDDWFGPDLEAWLRFQPHQLLALRSKDSEIHAYIEKR